MVISKNKNWNNCFSFLYLMNPSHIFQQHCKVSRFFVSRYCLLCACFFVIIYCLFNTSQKSVSFRTRIRRRWFSCKVFRSYLKEIIFLKQCWIKQNFYDQILYPRTLISKILFLFVLLFELLMTKFDYRLLNPSGESRF